MNYDVYFDRLDDRLAPFYYNAHTLVTLMKENPGVVKMSRIPQGTLATCLHLDFDLFVNRLADLPLDTRIFLLCRFMNDKRLNDIITISDKDVDITTKSQYATLLIIDFEKYIRKDKYNELSDNQKADLFIKHANWLAKHYGVPENLNGYALSRIAFHAPKVFNKHLSNHVCNESYAWIALIELNSKYKSHFLKNLGSLCNATYIRQVFYKYPELIKELTPNMIIDARLSVKQWILLISKLVEKHPEHFVNWAFPEEMISILKEELLSEVLSGKSSKSKILSNKMKHLFNLGD